MALLLAGLSACTTQETNNLVHTPAELEEALKQARPGDEIVLANGVWMDAELRISANGEDGKLITIRGEEPGGVILSGASNLAFSGSYLHIKDLVFRDGYTPTSEVLSFRTSKEDLANDCRVSGILIDHYSNPERFESDTWVAIYGKNNQFDHNSLVGKGNIGVTLAVKMNTEESRENNHIIEHNYFGPRDVLGSNGGETLRIGTSHYSRTYSNTTVRENYFDRCNGEHEVISNKACGNVFENNVFYECQGTLTMRHGHHTLVRNNYFLGNRKANTGGIRIINENQTVENNYLVGLTGHRFRGALVIMNGVPNSPINRYNQVVDSKMNNNVVLNSDYIQLCAGSDEERSAVPIGSSFSDNIILTESIEQPFTIYDDVSGISFSGNRINTEAPFEPGFEHIDYNLQKNENGLLSPDAALLEQINFGPLALPVSKADCGASYYSYEEPADFADGNQVQVSPGTNTLLEKIKTSAPGDVLELEGGATYLLTKNCPINHPLSIVCKGDEKAIIQSEKQSFFQIENGGALAFKGILFDGEASPDLAGNAVISTSKYSMNQNYSLVLEDCEVRDMDKNHSFHFLQAAKHTFADSIVFKNVSIDNLTGSVVKLTMEQEDLGVYNVENVILENCSFEEVQGEILNIYRGGTDESTFGPLVWVSDVKVSNSSEGKRNKAKACFAFHGVQYLDMKRVQIDSSAGMHLHLTNGEPRNFLEDIRFQASEGIRSNDAHFQTTKSIVEAL